MSQTKKWTITPAEWEVMRVVWANGPSTSKYIRDILDEDMGWKAATTKTLIGRLKAKEYLSVEQDGRQYIYDSTVSEKESFLSHLADQFSKVCNKKAGEYLKDFIQEMELSKDDIKNLQVCLKKKLDEAPDELTCNCIPGQCHC